VNLFPSRDKLKPYGGLKVATYHDAWKYFGQAFNVDTAATIEPKPAITPSPAEVRRVVDVARREGVKVVICETYNDQDLARFVADQAGAKLLVLPDHVHGVEGVNSYQDLFRYDVGKLIEAARAAGVEPHAPAGGASHAR